jgi:hypothetical protein
VLDPDGSLELASALLAATLFRYRCFAAVRLPQCHFSLWAIVGLGEQKFRAERLPGNFHKKNSSSSSSSNMMDMVGSIRRVADSQSCLIEYNNEVQLYNILVGVSLSVTFIVAILYFVSVRPRLSESTGLGSQFYTFASIVKAFIAILIAAIFVPKCPAACSCEDSAHFYIYPAVALFIAFRWWLRARALGLQQEHLPVVAIPEESVSVFRDDEGAHSKATETEMV